VFRKIIDSERKAILMLKCHGDSFVSWSVLSCFYEYKLNSGRIENRNNQCVHVVLNTRMFSIYFLTDTSSTGCCWSCCCCCYLCYVCF